jgi:tetratricopeptide (TPR) repeat protein
MAGAIVALAMWPFLGAHRTPAATITPAPVIADYKTRDQLIAFYEKEMRRTPTDQIKMRMLAGFYLQRFKEQYDLSDVTRAEALARRSIQLQPQGNTPAQMALANALLTYHHFRQAMVHERDAWMGEPSNANAQAQIASLQMELGQYGVAYETLKSIRRPSAENPTIDSVWARYDELTGKLPQARVLIDRAMQVSDSDINNPAADRSWFHMRAAQLAFDAGDYATAEREFANCLAIFPDNAMALIFQARMFRAEKRWHATLKAATAAARLYPLPQALGYKADAERALGLTSAAEQTDALIGAEVRLFNAQGINDRLLANYYAQRGVHLRTALRSARSDYSRRGDEIYADDTMGWVLGAMGRWKEARIYAERAVRYGTQDAEVQYHAGIVALHTGHLHEAKARLSLALSENSQFHPVEADDARAQLAKLP